jgi:tellurite resistance protein
MNGDLKKLGKQERMLLLEFVCAFAWADLEVRDEERQFVARLVRRMELEPDEVKTVDGWLRLPPRPEEIDPNRVPRAHRELFIDCARQLIESDGRIDPAERENLELFKQLI